MASITLVRTISFSIYQRAKHVYSGWIRRNIGFDVLQHVGKPGSYPNLYSIACFGAAGATAGSAITFLACPFELSKLSAQVSVLLAERATDCKKSQEVAKSYQNKGTLRTMTNIVKHRGIFGLYTGFKLHLRMAAPASNAVAPLLITRQCAILLEQPFTSWCMRVGSSSEPLLVAITRTVTSWPLSRLVACVALYHGP